MSKTASRKTGRTAADIKSRTEQIYPRPLGGKDKKRLDDLYRALCEARSTHAGYPCNMVFDYSELNRFLEFPINNVGDPFGKTNFSVNTHAIEREMIRFFANITKAPKDGFWGYITAGGTEGNMYGLYLARELMGKDATVYFSEDTHYSVSKIMRLLDMRHIMIKSAPGGEIDCEDLRETVRIHRDRPVIIMANAGTTMKGAVDDIAEIRSILEKFAIKKSYIHCDAALSGMVLPFVKNPPPFGFPTGMDSVAISGHKLIGSPFPCGVALVKKENVKLIARNIEYIGALDTTISGSRNAFAALALWYAVRRYGVGGLRKLVGDSIALADFAVKRFRENGVEAWRNENSITVVFPRPAEKTAEKWQLASKDDISHIITLPHLNRATIEAIVKETARDLEKNRKEKPEK